MKDSLYTITCENSDQFVRDALSVFVEVRLMAYPKSMNFFTAVRAELYGFYFNATRSIGTLAVNDLADFGGFLLSLPQNRYLELVGINHGCYVLLKYFLFDPRDNREPCFAIRAEGLNDMYGMPEKELYDWRSELEDGKLANIDGMDRTTALAVINGTMFDRIRQFIKSEDGLSSPNVRSYPFWMSLFNDVTRKAFAEEKDFDGLLNRTQAFIHLR